jgi:hypothetical protein
VERVPYLQATRDANKTVFHSERKLDHWLALLRPINSIFGLLGSWVGPEVALKWLFPYPLITTRREQMMVITAEYNVVLCVLHSAVAGCACCVELRVAPCS